MKNSFCLILLMTFACVPKKNADEQKSEIQLFDSPAKGKSSEPFLFTDKDGTVYMSWIEKGDEISTFKFSRLQNANWSTPVTIANGKTWVINWADYPMIAANGKQLVAHFLNRSGENEEAYDVNLTTSTDGGTTWTARLFSTKTKRKQNTASFRSFLMEIISS